LHRRRAETQRNRGNGGRDSRHNGCCEAGHLKGMTTKIKNPRLDRVTIT
jgi:hypothetical protein